MQRKLIAFSTALVTLAMPAVANAATSASYTPTLSGGTLINFEGQAEGTLISNQYPGVVFSQGGTSARPQIDNFPMLFGYGASSGSGVLTGSLEGGSPFVTIAPITATFTAPTSAFEFFFSDTSPLGNYVLSVLGAGGATLETRTILASQVLPPGYGGGPFPPPGTMPLPGLYLGGSRLAGDIFGFTIAGLAQNDSYAIDDVRFLAPGAPVPEPTSWAMMIAGMGIVGSALRRRTKVATSVRFA